MNSERVVISGSDRAAPAGATRVGPAPPAERTTVTIVVRSPHPSPAAAARMAELPPDARTYLTRDAFARAHGATPDDVLAVQRFALASGLVVLQADLARRSVLVEGTLAALAAAFATALDTYRGADGGIFRARTGTLSVPAEIGPIVCGVFGLDERPQARAQFRFSPAAAGDVSYEPRRVAGAYAFPPGDGTGQTIALVELGGGFARADLDAFFSGLGLATPMVTSVSVDGATNAPTGDPASADAEVLLDIEVAGAIAPGAKIVVYFSPNTDQGFLDAITTAIHDSVNAPQVLSISWGGPEARWTAQAFANFDAAFADAAMLGVTVLCAAGDNGSGDGVGDGLAHVDFPASSPHVLGCGGTRLDVAAASAETVWNDGAGAGATGGGVSDVFALPDWQGAANVPPSVNPGARIGRGVPDVAGDADPRSGYAVLIDGKPSVVGGTSAVAPLWAALVARLNAARAKPLGFLNPLLYAHPEVLRDVVAGDNGAYAARAGWDACTGLGTPDGTRIAALVVPAVTP